MKSKIKFNTSIYLFIGLLLFFFSCNYARPPILEGSVEKESFCLNIGRDTVLLTKEGAIIFVSSDAFLNHSNIEVEEVDLRIKTITKKSEMITSNVTTQSDGQLLISDGMIRVEAFIGDQPVELNASNGIVLHIPKKTPSQPFSVYVGEESITETNSVNWITDESAFSDLLIDVYSICLLQTDGRFTSVSSSSYSNGDTYWDSLRKAITRIKIHPSTYPKLTENLASAKEIPLSFSVNDEGEIQINLQGLQDQDLSGVVIEEIEDLYAKNGHYPYWNEGVEFRSALCHARVLIDSTEDYYINTFEQKYSPMVKEGLNIYEADLKYYIFGINKVGWFNLDSPYPLDQNKVTLSIDCPNFETTDVFLIFKNFNSVISPSRENEQFVFPNLPPGELVTIFAHNYGAHPDQFIDTTFVTSQQKIILTKFRAMSIDEIRSKLERIDD